MSDDGNAELCNEIKKESKRILTGIPQQPNDRNLNVTQSLDLSGLKPIEVYYTNHFFSQLRLRNQESEELKRKNSDADTLLKSKEERNRDIGREIQKLKEIAEQKRAQEQESKSEEKRFEQSINESKIRLEKLEHEIKECHEKLKEARDISANLAEMEATHEKLQSEYLNTKRSYMQNIKKLCVHVNAQRLLKQLSDSVLDIGGDGNNVMNNESVSKAVEMFHKMKKQFKEKPANQLKRPGDNTAVPSGSTKKAKKSEAAGSANIPVITGASVPQPAEADPRLRSKHRLLYAAAARREPAPVQASNNVGAVVQHGLLPQVPLGFFRTHPPPRVYPPHRHSYGPARGYSHGYLIPPPPPMYPRIPRFYGPGFNLPPTPVPMPLTPPPRRQPLSPPMRPQYQAYRRY